MVPKDSYDSKLRTFQEFCQDYQKSLSSRTFMVLTHWPLGDFNLILGR